MKVCSRCKFNKENSAFGLASKAKDGLHWWCKACLCSYEKSKRQANPVRRRYIQKTHRDVVGNAKRRFIQDAKKRPCADCGVEYNSWIMQFDHLPGHEKHFMLSKGFLRSMESIIAEIAKCEVVCANCHLERTHSRLK